LAPPPERNTTRALPSLSRSDRGTLANNPASIRGIPSLAGMAPRVFATISGLGEIDFASGNRGQPEFSFTSPLPFLGVFPNGVLRQWLDMIRPSIGMACLASGVVRLASSLACPTLGMARLNHLHCPLNLRHGLLNHRHGVPEDRRSAPHHPRGGSKRCHSALRVWHTKFTLFFAYILRPPFCSVKRPPSGFNRAYSIWHGICVSTTIYSGSGITKQQFLQKFSCVA